MTPTHAIVAVATLFALVYCGHDTACNAHMATMERVAMLILGVIGGNAYAGGPKPPTPPQPSKVTP